MSNKSEYINNNIKCGLAEISIDLFSEIKEENRDLLIDITNNILLIANDEGKLKTLATVVSVWAEGQ